MTIGEHLKELRQQRKKTQKEIAAYLKIAERSYQRYESGERNLDIETIIKLAHFYNTTTDDILCFKK